MSFASAALPSIVLTQTTSENHTTAVNKTDASLTTEINFEGSEPKLSNRKKADDSDKSSAEKFSRTNENIALLDCHSAPICLSLPLNHESLNGYD